MELLIPRPVHRAPLVYPDDELGPVLRAFAREQEEGTATQPLGPVNQRVTTVWGPGQQFPWSDGAYLDDEILGSGGLEDFWRENEEGTDTLRTVNQRQSVPWGPGQQFPWSDGAYLDDEVQGSGGLKNYWKENEEGTDTLPTVNRVQANPWIDRPFADEGEAVPQLRYDQEEPPYVRTEALPWTAAVFLDDEFSTNLAAFGLEQEEGTPTSFNVDQVQTVPWLAAPFSEDMTSAGLAYFPIEQEDDYLKATEVQPWLSRPFGDDDLPPNPRNYFRDDEAAPAPVLPVLWWSYPAWTARPAADEDPWTTAPSFLGLDLEEPPYIRAESQPWFALPFSDDETSAQLVRFGLEQEEPTYLRVESLTWAAVPFADEASVPPQLPLDQEESWIGRVQAVSWAGVPFSDGEFAPSLPFDQEELWSAATTAYGWPQAFTPGDESPVAALAVGEEYSWGLPSARQSAPSLATLLPTDGGSEVAPAPFGLDSGEGWAAVAPWRVWVAFRLFLPAAEEVSTFVFGVGGGAVAGELYSFGSAATTVYCGGPVGGEVYSGGPAGGEVP